jgi:hypothetical protein
MMATTRHGADAAPEHGRDFVEVLPGQDRVADRPATDATLAPEPAPPSIIQGSTAGPVATTGPAATAAMAEPRWNLWGDLEI